MTSLENVRAQGNRKEVIPVPNNPEQVRAYFYRDSESFEQAKGTWILQRLTNILIPGLMPEVLAFGTAPFNGKPDVPYMDMKRVALDDFHLAHHPSIGKEIHNAHVRDYYEQHYRSTTEERKRALEKLAEYGLLKNTRKDNHPGNWSVAEDIPLFLDMQPPWKTDKKGMYVTFDRDKISEKINSLPDAEVQKEAELLLAELIKLTPPSLFT